MCLNPEGAGGREELTIRYIGWKTLIYRQWSKKCVFCLWNVDVDMTPESWKEDCQYPQMKGTCRERIKGTISSYRCNRSIEDWHCQYFDIINWFRLQNILLLSFINFASNLFLKTLIEISSYYKLVNQSTCQLQGTGGNSRRKTLSLSLESKECEV